MSSARELRRVFDFEIRLSVIAARSMAPVFFVSALTAGPNLRRQFPVLRVGTPRRVELRRRRH